MHLKQIFVPAASKISELKEQHALTRELLEVIFNLMLIMMISLMKERVKTLLMQLHQLLAKMQLISN